MATKKPITAEVYRLAAQYWHPLQRDTWDSFHLLNAATDAADWGDKIEDSFAALDVDSEQDVRCWYYLFRAEEAES